MTDPIVTIPWAWVGSVLQALILGVATFVAKTVIQVRDEVRRTNGRLNVLETRLDAHEERDDDRFHELRDRWGGGVHRK